MQRHKIINASREIKLHRKLAELSNVIFREGIMDSTYTFHYNLLEKALI